MHIALPLWGGCWIGLGVEVARNQSLEELAFTVCVSQKRKTGLWKEPLGRLCCTQLMTWSDFVLACTHSYKPWAGSVCWEQGKHQLKSCQGSDFQCQTRCAMLPMCPQTSAHTWWVFSPGACSVKVAVAWEPAGWNREWNNLVHKK